MTKTYKAWAGIDIGKVHHWVCVLDADGMVLLSMKVANDEGEIIAMISTVTGLAEELVWAVDIIGTPSALVLALLARAEQSVRYASGRVVAAMSAAFVGEVKPMLRTPTSSLRPLASAATSSSWTRTATWSAIWLCSLGTAPI